MTIPFALGFSGALVAAIQQPLAWWKEGTNLYTNTGGTIAATVAGDAVRNWTDCVGGYAATQGGTGPSFPPELHSDLLAVRFDRDPNFLTGAAVLAGLLDGSDTPFSAILRFQTAAALGLSHSAWALAGTGAAAGVSNHGARTTATPQWQNIRRDDALAVVNDLYGTPATATAYTRSLVFNGTTYDEWIDGSQTRTAVAMDVGACTWTQVIIGAADDTGGASMDGLIWHLLFFAGAINETTRLHWEARVA